MGISWSLIKSHAWLGCSPSDLVIPPQGVTLTDLQEAERTFSRARAERQAQEQPSPEPGPPAGLEGGTQKHEPSAAPAKEAGESQSPWGQSTDEEVSGPGAGCLAGRAASLGSHLPSRQAGAAHRRRCVHL